MDGWVLLPVAARHAYRSTRTVRGWVDGGQVRSACRVGDGRIVVWWPDVFDMTLSAGRRLRSAS